MKKFLSLLLVVALMFTCASLVACSKDDDKDPVIGTYALTSMSYNGEERELPEGASMTMEIKEDGTVVMTESYNGESDSENGTWVKNDNVVTITLDGNATDLTFADNKLTYSEDGYVQVFTKQ